MPPITPAPAGSPEAKAVGALLVTFGNAGKQYRTQALAEAKTFDVKVENGIVTVEDAAIAHLSAGEQIVVKGIVGLLNSYVDANLDSFEGDAYDALCNYAISEGQRLQA